MTTRRPYTYILLRYRHDPVAGEFANVGVILHEPASRFLDIKVRRTVGRLSKMFPDLDGDVLKSSLRGIERAVKRMAQSEGSDLLTTLKDAGAFARRALPDDDTSFFWGPIGSGTTNNAAETLDRLFARFVSRYDERPRPHRDDAAVWKPVRDRLAERHLADRLQVKTITSPLDRVEFQHAWKNGAWHCYQPLSFDLANEENIREKARRWTGHMLALSEATEPFRPYFLVGAPSDQRLASAYEAALGILKLSPVNPKIFEETEVDELVDQIEDEIRAHDAASG